VSASEPARWVTRDSAALLTDLYELTMAQAYWREGMHDDAVFSLFVRRLPPERNFLLACGLNDVLSYLESLRFGNDALDFLRGLPEFQPDFLDYLASFRFTGEVRAVPEGTAVFENEPILEVTAPLPEAQVIETFLMNQVHLQTVLASKAARVVAAADGRPVVDFGLRRMHGADAGLKAARAFRIAGVDATSNVLAGQIYGIPVTGTMAHSYIQTHDSELEAFRAFTRTYPDTVLLVDTYDTLEGVRNVIRLARELGSGFRVRAIRLDSGDLAPLAREARALLDQAGLQRVQIFASGGLDEHAIDRILEASAPIDGFGVGTGMGVSSDVPALDIVYKLTEYGGRGRLKLSTGKPVLPGPKQLFREYRDGLVVGDTIGEADEELPGQPLLRPVMRDGRRLDAGQASLEEARQHAAAQLRSLPGRLRARSPAEPIYPVRVSPSLRTFQEEVTRKVQVQSKVVHDG
jgi:nicotinate phosphoribosyltransferase